MNSPHQIGRVTLRCKIVTQMGFSGEAVRLANNTADELSTFCREKLPALLDKAFQKSISSGQEEITSIDTLEVDLGKISFSQLENVLAQKIEDQLRQAQYMKGAMSSREWFFHIVSSYLETGVSPWNSGRLSTQGWIDGLSSLCAEQNFRDFLLELAAKHGDVVMGRMASLLDGFGMESELNEYGQVFSAHSALFATGSDKSENVLMSDTILMPDTIFVSNAGLVLFAPFLSFFFKRLNLVDEDYRFLGDERCSQAIKILQRLTYPDERVVVEGDLALNKLLCGWPLCEPLLPIAGEISDEQVNEEFVLLLDAITEQWDAINGYSHLKLAGLFLQRAGALRMKSATSMDVEWLPQDVLLKTLPWPLSIIQTPWMEAPLRIDWDR